MSKEMIDTDKEWRKIADALFDERDKLKQQLEQSQRDLQIARQALEEIAYGTLAYPEVMAREILEQIEHKE